MMFLRFLFSLINPLAILQAFRELIQILRCNGRLAFEMARREITDRYMGQVFGLFWMVGQPVVLICVYVFIFTFVFRMKIGGTMEMPLDYTTYILSGIIPWMAFIESMSKSSTSITGNVEMVKRIIFPVEILPVKSVFATFVTQLILTGLQIVYVLATHYSLPWTYALLPVLLALQMMAMIGVSYILSSIGVYVRDTKELVQAFSLMGLYLIPAFYLPESIPGIFRYIIYLNPFSYMVWCYQDALYFGRFAHPWAWVVMVTLSLVAFANGYRVFRKLRITFGNVL